MRGWVETEGKRFEGPEAEEQLCLDHIPGSGHPGQGRDLSSSSRVSAQTLLVFLLQVRPLPGSGGTGGSKTTWPRLQSLETA